MAHCTRHREGLLPEDTGVAVIPHFHGPLTAPLVSARSCPSPGSQMSGHFLTNSFTETEDRPPVQKDPDRAHFHFMAHLSGHGPLTISESTQGHRRLQSGLQTPGSIWMDAVQMWEALISPNSRHRSMFREKPRCTGGGQARSRSLAGHIWSLITGAFKASIFGSQIFFINNGGQKLIKINASETTCHSWYGAPADILWPSGSL